jgi:DNA-binding MarR family transcriptional regulator
MKSPTSRFDLDRSIAFLVYRAHQRALAEYRRALEPAGLTPQQFGLLALLYERDGQRQAELCVRGATDPNTMVGLIDRLTALGLVQRRRDPGDRRAHLIFLTPAGRRTFRRWLPAQRRAGSRCWQALTRAEQQRLRELLLKVLQPKGNKRRGGSSGHG